MPTKTAATKTAAKPAAAPREKFSVFEAWGKAFTDFGTKPNAPKLIVEFMENRFPTKKTKWAKWVNVQRIAFNAGKLPNTKKPAEPIAVYK